MTSVDWEKTGTRTSVSAREKGNLRCSRSVGRQVDDDDTECKVNVKLWCSFETKFFVMASFKTMQDLIFLSRTSNFIDDEEFFSVVWPFWVELSVRNYSTFNLNEMTESECLSEFRFRKRHIWCDSCFPWKVYFLYIKDIWFALPKYTQCKNGCRINILLFKLKSA